MDTTRYVPFIHCQKYNFFFRDVFIKTRVFAEGCWNLLHIGPKYGGDWRGWEKDQKLAPVSCFETGVNFWVARFFQISARFFQLWNKQIISTKNFPGSVSHCFFSSTSPWYLIAACKEEHWKALEKLLFATFCDQLFCVKFEPRGNYCMRAWDEGYLK